MRILRTTKLIHVLIMLGAVICILYYVEAETKLFSSVISDSKELAPEGITYQYGSDSKAIFGKGTKGILCVTKDGATFYSYKGEAIWRQTFTMTSPYIIQSGDNFAILEPMGQVAYVCDSTGVLYTTPTEYSILGAGINKMALLILIVQAEDNTYRILLYNQEGAIPIERKSEMEGVFPICADITNDGYMFAAGYLDTSKSALVTRVLYNYTDYGAEKLAQNALLPFKAIEKQDSIISKLYFSGDDKLAVVLDDEILITTKLGEDVATVKPSNKIASSVFADNFFGIINGESLPDSDMTTTKGMCQWYGYDGNLIGEFDEEEIKELAIFDDLLLLKSENNYYCIDKKGNILWTIGAAQDITAVIPIDKNRALIAKTGYAEIYKLKKIDKTS